MKQEQRPVQEFEISDVLCGLSDVLCGRGLSCCCQFGKSRCNRWGASARASDRKVLNSIFYLLQTGGQWQSLDSLDPTRYGLAPARSRIFLLSRADKWLEYWCAMI